MNEHPRADRDDSVSAVAVVVPVNNEEVLLPRCLAALDVSVAALHRTWPTIDVKIVIVLDACTDGSAAVTARHDVHVTTLDEQCVGSARASGVALAASLLGVGVKRAPRAAWLANTDADSVVPPDWLTHQVASADRGADLVIGRVRPDPQDSNERLQGAWAFEHRSADPLSHVHGANLGVRWEVFNAVGGFPGVPEHEDVLLVEALLSAAVRVAPGREVLTSGRTRGRVPGGFSGYLRTLLIDPGGSSSGV